jgi:hypothetical protein
MDFGRRVPGRSKGIRAPAIDASGWRRTDKRRRTGHAYGVGTSLVMVGGLAIVAASFLPWLTVNFGIGPFTRNGFQSWNSAKLNVDGVATVTLGMLTVGIALVRASNWAWICFLERVAVVTAGCVALLLSYRVPSLVSLANRVSASYAGVTAKVGYGIWLMAAGTVCAVLGGFIVGDRQRDIAHAALALAGGVLIAVSSVMPWFTVELGVGHFARNGFQLGNDLGFSLDGVIAVVAGLTSMGVGLRRLRNSGSTISSARVPIAAGLAALAVVADQLPSLQSLGAHVKALYGGGNAGAGFGLNVLIAGAGLAIAGGLLARGQAGELWTDSIFVGGVLIGAASVLPWFTVMAGVVPDNFTGFELGRNAGWSIDGLIVLVAGFLIVASRVVVRRKGRSATRSLWLSVIGLAGASALLGYRLPLLYSRAHRVITGPTARANGRIAYGIWVCVAGEVFVAVGCLWAARADLTRWSPTRFAEKATARPPED